MSRIFALVALAGLAALSGTAAQAQYYDPYDRPPPPRYDYDRPAPRDWEYERRRPRYDDERPYYRQRRFGEMCVTSRGSCESQPAPVNAPCRCFFDGFGPKRGAIQ